MMLQAELDAMGSRLLGRVGEMIARSGVRTVRVVDVPVVLGARGQVLAVGDHVFLRLGLNGAATVLNWSIAATVTGVSSARTCVLDILVGATLATATSICATNRPSLTAQAERDEQAPTGWLLPIPDPSWMLVRVVSTDGVLEVVGLTLRVTIGVDSTVSVVGLLSGDVLADLAGDEIVYGG